MITQRYCIDYSLIAFKTHDKWYEEELHRDHVKTRIYICYAYRAQDISPGQYTLARTDMKYYRR